jgi:hypothetical protein
LEFLFLHESREACKLVLSIPEGNVERRTAVHPVCAFTSIGRDCVGCFVGMWKGDCLGSSSRGQPHGALPLHQVTQRQVIKFTDLTRRSGHTTCYMCYKGVCISPHHGMVEWFIIQSFYHGLICSAREHIDVPAGGSFFTLSIEEAHKLVEKMASNQSWDEERTQTHTRKVHQLIEVDMLNAKIDLLMKKLENLGLDHLKMGDAQVTWEECREMGHMGINYPTVP